MGLDISAIFGNIQKDVSAGMNDVLKLGGNAALGYLEDQAIKILEADKADKEKIFKTDLATILKRPGSGDSLGAYLGNVAQSPIIKEYGPYILMGVCIVAVGTVMLRGK